MKELFFVFLLGILLTSYATADDQTLVVSDYGYTLNGVTRKNLNELDDKLQSGKPLLVQACTCADTTFVIEAVQWAQRQGATKISMITMPMDENSCGKCK